MARSFRTTFVIDGDSSGAVAAQRAARQEAESLNREMATASQRGDEMAASFETVQGRAATFATVIGATAAAVGAVSLAQIQSAKDASIMADALDMTTQRLQELQYAASRKGIADIGDILKDVSDKIGDAFANGGGAAMDAIENLNLSIEDLITLKPDEQLLAIAQGLKGLPKGEQVNVMESLGSDAIRLLPLLEDNGRALNEFTGQAREAGVALNEFDNQQLLAASAALDEMQGYAEGLANQLALRVAPTIIDTAESVGELVDDFGGMQSVAGKLTTAVGGLAAVLGTRLAVSLAGATAALGKKVLADIAANKAAADSTAAEAGHQSTLARTVAAEKAAAASSANIAAQRAMASRAAVAQDAQRLASTQASLAAERALETQRLQAQISATGRQQSIARIAELRASETTITNQLTAANVRLTETEIAETSAQRAATASSIESTRANAAATTAMGGYTAAATAAARANGVLATTARAASRAMMLVGGPAGAAVLAAGAMIYFHEELTGVAGQAERTAERVDDLTNAINTNSEAAVKGQLVNLTAQMFDLEQQSIAANAALDELSTGNTGSGFLGAEGGRTGEQAAAIQELGRIASEMEAVGKSSDRLREIQKRLREEGTAPTVDSVRDLGDAQSEAAKEAEKQASALESLRRQLDPAYAAQQQLAEQTATLDQALQSGALTLGEYLDLWDRAAGSFIGADESGEAYQKRLDELTGSYDANAQKAQQLEQAVGDINKAYRNGDIDGDQYARMMGNVRDEMRQLAVEADPMAQEMARAWDEAADRIDETFADAFTGAFDSFEDFGDQLLDGFKRLLGELAYQATLKPIVVEFTGQMKSAMGIAGSGSPAASSGGSLMDLASTGKNIYSMGSKAWEAGSTLLAGGQAAQTAASVATTGGLYGAATTSGLYASAATGGTIASGAAATGGMLSGAMGALSTAMPYLGAIMAADSLLDLGIMDGVMDGISGLFGGFSGVDPNLVFKTEGEYGTSGRAGFEREISAQSALGQVGFARESRDLDYAFDSFEKAQAYIDQVAQLDNVFAQAAGSDSGLAAMQQAVQQMGNLDRSPEEFLEQRYRTAFDTLDSRFEDLVMSIQGDAQGFVSAAVAVTQVEPMLGSFSDAVQNKVVSSISGSAEEIVESAGRMATSLQALTLLDASAERLGLQIDTTSAKALDAAYSMQEMAGGIDNLASIQQGYYQAVYSENERLSNSVTDLIGQFSAAGAEMPTTVEQLREMVESQQLSTEAGRELQLQLMQLAPSFADTTSSVSDAIAQQYQEVLDRAPDAGGLSYWMGQITSGAVTLDGALERIASSVEATGGAVQEAAKEIDLSPVQSAYSALQESIDAERQAEQAAFEATTSSIRDNIASMNDAMRDTEQTADSLSSTLASMLAAGSGSSTSAFDSAAATLREIRDSGGLGDPRELERALSAVAQPDESAYGSYEDYARAAYSTANIVDDLKDRAEDQLSAQERAVLALEAQMRQATREHNAEMERLDGMLEAQTLEIEALFGQQQWLQTVNTSVLSVVDAVAALGSAMSEAQAQASASNGSGGVDAEGDPLLTGATGSIADAYRSALGRDPDDSGYAYWEGRAAAGMPVGDIISSIGASDEAAQYRETGVPQFADGGIASGPTSGYPVELHGTEAVIPLKGGAVPVRMSGGMNPAELVAEIRALREQVAKLEAYAYQTTKNTGQAAKQLRRADDGDRLRVVVENS